MTEEPPSTSLQIAVLAEDPLWASDLPGAEDLARRMAMAAWTCCLAEAAPGLADGAPCEVTLVLADDDLIADLNQRYRGRSGPTNVLSFADLSFPDLEAARPVSQAGPRLLGDVVLARQTIVREAEEQGKSPADHLAHLVVHGLLHLQGYDHQTDVQAAIMEGLERRILARQGVPDPYRESAEADPEEPAEAVP